MLKQRLQTRVFIFSEGNRFSQQNLVFIALLQVQPFSMLCEPLFTRLAEHQNFLEENSANYECKNIA